jgi:hypothetical protein
MDVGVGDGVIVGETIIDVGVNADTLVNSIGMLLFNCGSRARNMTTRPINIIPIIKMSDVIRVIGLKIDLLPDFLVFSAISLIGERLPVYIAVIIAHSVQY